MVYTSIPQIKATALVEGVVAAGNFSQYLGVSPVA
jgi:hypothetical protein